MSFENPEYLRAHGQPRRSNSFTPGTLRLVVTSDGFGKVWGDVKAIDR